NHDVLLILWNGVVDFHGLLTPADIERIAPGLEDGYRVEPYLWVFWDHGAPTAEVVVDGVLQVANPAMGLPLEKSGGQVRTDVRVLRPGAGEKMSEAEAYD